ncbi:hypothetical protein F183_A33580 [Bryobacterales bacterium F-183]|nr:hypothetical protein F183_A33580 [Bryobacterales bacterium F-183]
MKTLLTLLIAGAACVSADTLTFDGNNCAADSSGIGAATPCFDLSAINQTYGDTAQVNVTYADANFGVSLGYWGGGYNDLTGIVWAAGGDPGSFGRITLELLIPGTITLNSLDMGAFPNTTLGTNLRIYGLGGGSPLYTFSGNVGTPPNATPFSFSNISSTNGLIIEWQNSAYNVGMDNIDFTITPTATGVPEPSSMAILVLGAGGLLTVSRRRR